MRRSLSALAALLLGVSMLGIGSAKATVVTYDFDTEFSGATAPAGPTPWLTAEFSDEVVGLGVDEVQLTLSAPNLVGSEFVSAWYFNVEPFQTIDFTHQSGVADTSTSSSEDAFKADGNGWFDILIEYAANTFGPGDTSVFLLEASGLTASMFDKLSVSKDDAEKGGLSAAAHVQGIGGLSGWVAPGGPQPGVIPIMGALPLLLSALGLLGFAGGWWRRWRSA